MRDNYRVWAIDARLFGVRDEATARLDSWTLVSRGTWPVCVIVNRYMVDGIHEGNGYLEGEKILKPAARACLHACLRI